MSNVSLIMIGLSIGMQLVASFFIFKLAFFKYIITAPWIIIGVAGLLRAYSLIDALWHPDVYAMAATSGRLLVSFLSSLLLMVGFGWLWAITKNKYGKL